MGIEALVAIVAVLQALLVVAWVFGTRLPGTIGGLLIGAGTSIAADVAVLLPDRPAPSDVVGVLALALPALLVHQLSRGVVRRRVTESMSDIGLLCVALVALAVPVALVRYADGGTLALAGLVGGAAAVAVARLVAVAVRSELGPWLAVVPGAAAGAGVGALFGARVDAWDGGQGALFGAAVGAVCAVLVIGVGFMVAGLNEEGAGRDRAALAYLYLALPLAAAGPVAYAVGTAVAG